jgi:hypothetical protein
MTGDLREFGHCVTGSGGYVGNLSDKYCLVRMCLRRFPVDDAKHQA